MFLHLIISAALLAPGANGGPAAGPTIAMVCSVAADMHAARPRSSLNIHPARSARTVLAVTQAHPAQTGRLTTQLRR